LEFGLGLSSRFSWADNWIADAHRDRKRFVVHAEEILTAFLELESAMRAQRELI
jgi:hypothetical protein